MSGRRDVVGRHAAAGEEVAEVERRAVDRAAAAAGPLDLGDLLAAALGRLGERLGLQDVRALNAAVVLVNGWPLTWNVLFVEPCTPGHAPVASVNQPAPVFGGAWVSRPLSDAYAPCSSRSRKPGDDALVARTSRSASWRMPSDAKNSSLGLFFAAWLLELLPLPKAAGTDSPATTMATAISGETTFLD